MEHPDRVYEALFPCAESGYLKCQLFYLFEEAHLHLMDAFEEECFDSITSVEKSKLITQYFSGEKHVASIVCKRVNLPKSVNTKNT